MNIKEIHEIVKRCNIKKTILYTVFKFLQFWLVERRKPIPEKMKKTIFQQFNSECAFCFNDNINVLEIHHIENYSECKVHEEDNLILVCSNCHRKVENNEITLHQTYGRKIDAINGTLEKRKRLLKSQNIVEFQLGSVIGSTVITGGNVTIKNASKSKPSQKELH